MKNLLNGIGNILISNNLKKILFWSLNFLLFVSCVEKEQLQAPLRVLPTDSPYVPKGYSLYWMDEFPGTTINQEKWVAGTLRDPITGNKMAGAIGDYMLNNNYCGYITAEDSYIKDGCLVLRNQKRNITGTSPSGTFQYSTGWVHSMHRVYFNKGYIEMKAKYPIGDKVWPAFWLLSEDGAWGPEWDIMEYFGYREDVGYDNMANYLCSGDWPNEKWFGGGWLKGFNSKYNAAEWHVYGFEWTETYAKWFVDGVEVNSVLAANTTNWPNENMYIILNNGQRTKSPDNNTVWPNYFEIDYIKIYKK